MKIRKLRLQNFRGFEDKTFEFSDQFNVLIGDNGTGKTSILKALTVVASPIIDLLGGGRTLAPSVVVEPDDVRRVCYVKGTTFTLEPQYPVVLSSEGVFVDKEFGWIITQSEEGSTREGSDLRPVAEQLIEQVKGGVNGLLPLVASYPAERLWPTKKQSGWHKPGSRIEGYSGWWKPSSNMELIMGWLKAQEAIALQQTANSVLTAVKQAIVHCIENVGEILYDFKEDDLIAKSVDGSRVLPFRMLSDGERNMLAMVADIARRAAILNPHLEERALTQTPGIVLIDEIDLHLHPRWQRRVVDNLRETFPNLQFIATTHSPFIIQSLRAGELIDLNEGEPAEYVDKPIDYVAEYVQGVSGSSPRYEKMMEVAEEYYRVLQQAEGASSEEVERLKKRLDELVAPFSDDMAYHAFLKMEREAAGLGKNNT